MASMAGPEMRAADVAERRPVRSVSAVETPRNAGIVGDLAVSLQPVQLPAEPDPVQQEQIEPAPASEGESASGPELVVDVDALARNCALLGMEAPRRWSRPVNARTRPSAAVLPSNGAAPPSAAVVPLPVQPVPIFAPRERTEAPAPAVTAAAAPPSVAARTVVPPPRKRISARAYVVIGTIFLLLVFAALVYRSPKGAAPAILGGSAAAPAVSAQITSAAPITTDAAARTSATAALTSIVDVVDNISGSHSARRERPTRRGSEEPASDQPVRKVDPIYPAAAKVDGVQGTVVLGAVISRDGSLHHIRALSGDPLLEQAALDAVRYWVYKPRSDRGRAIETPIQISINFRLNDRR
jgi:TonB family protein